MGLRDLMAPDGGLPMSLPAYMRALDEGLIPRPRDSDTLGGVVADDRLPPKPAPAAAVGPSRAQQVLDRELEQWRAVKAERATYNRHAMAETIRRRINAPARHHDFTNLQRAHRLTQALEQLETAHDR
jgi:hypothetical protein